MPDASQQEPRRLLDPISRISEILFGVIMVLTFTGSFSVATAGQQETRAMLIGAIGCNLAWGLVDAVMYLMTRLTERARRLLMLRSVRNAVDFRDAQRKIADALPTEVASVLEKSELEVMRRRLSQLREPRDGQGFTRDDWLNALGVFLLVFLSTFPIVLPFLFMENASRALRASNGIAIVMLFMCGYSLGRYAGQRPWLVGLVMVIVGAALVAITVVLGG